MNAFRAATRLAPRAAARATGSFQQQTASSEFAAKSGWRRYAGEAAHAMMIGGPPSNRWFLYAHYQRIMVEFCGWEAGWREVGGEEEEGLPYCLLGGG